MNSSGQCRLIEISGAPEQRGRQYGQQAVAEIRRAIAHYESQLRDLKIDASELSRIIGTYIPTIAAFDPRCIEEMRGIAAGAGVDFEQIVMLNARTELLELAADPSLLRHIRDVAATDGCTSLIVEPEAAADGRLIHAHNWDWKVDSADASVVLRIRNDDGPDILTFTEAGALARFGFNSRGIAITANYLESDRDYSQVGVPLPLIRRKVLEQTHLAPAIRTVCVTPKSASNNIAVSDSGGGIVFDFECAPDETFRVEPQQGVLVHANHWQSPVALAKLREEGVAASPDSLCRERRVRKLLADRLRPLTVEDVKAILLDDWGTPWSICRPPRPGPGGIVTATVATLIMRPSLGSLELAMLPAAGATFAKYDLTVVKPPPSPTARAS
jgi:isopenicillin-N N-acyltransferase like protein